MENIDMLDPVAWVRVKEQHATLYEKLRDVTLLMLDEYTKTKAFLVLTVLWALAVVVFGVLSLLPLMPVLLFLTSYLEPLRHTSDL